MKPVVILYNYQTLIAGLLALGGAIWTVATIRRQIAEADRHETERRRRQNFAARAMMPVALNELSNYSKRCVELLLPLLPKQSGQLVTAHITQNAPAIPAEAVFTLRESTEFGVDPIAITIADLIRKLQIQHSRLADIENWLSSSGRIIVRPNILEFIVDALEIYARSAKLFAYARRESENAPDAPNENDLTSAAHNCSIWDSHGEVFELIKRRYPKAEV